MRGARSGRRRGRSVTGHPGRETTAKCAPIQNVRIVLPRGDLDERVGANQKEQLRTGQAAFMKTAQGERRSDGASWPSFDVGGLPSGAACDRQCDHRKPVIRARRRLRPVRGMLGRDDEYLRSGRARTGPHGPRSTCPR